MGAESIGPNPTRGAVSFAFTLRAEQHASLAIHDVSGRLVRRLTDATLAAGRHRLTWDGTDAAGRRVRTGVYFYTLRSDGQRWTRRLVVAH